MQDWNQLARRLSGVSQTVGMCWELVNREWKVWMPVRLLQSLSVAERGVSFQDRRFLAIGTSREDDLCNDVSQDGVIVCYTTVVPHFIWGHILHSYKRYVTIFATAGNENVIGRSPDQFFPCGEKESRYVQTLLMRNKLRSLPLRCDFTLSSLQLSHCWTVLYLAGWLCLLQPGHKSYRKRTASCSMNAISLSVQIQQFSSTWRLPKVVLLEGLFD